MLEPYINIKTTVESFSSKVMKKDEEILRIFLFQVFGPENLYLGGQELAEYVAAECQRRGLLVGMDTSKAGVHVQGGGFFNSDSVELAYTPPVYFVADSESKKIIISSSEDFNQEYNLSWGNLK